MVEKDCLFLNLCFFSYWGSFVWSCSKMQFFARSMEFTFPVVMSLRHFRVLQSWAQSMFFISEFFSYCCRYTFQSIALWQFLELKHAVSYEQIFHYAPWMSPLNPKTTWFNNIYEHPFVVVKIEYHNYLLRSRENTTTIWLRVPLVSHFFFPLLPLWCQGLLNHFRKQQLKVW